jgi:type IV pilus assembly protein PilA
VRLIHTINHTGNLTRKDTIMLRHLKNKGNQKGFTLIELMIVIAVIGILAAVAIPNFIRYKTNAENAAAEMAVKNAYTAALAYLSENYNRTWSELDKTMLIEGGFTDTENVVTTKPTGPGSVITSIPVAGSLYYTVDEQGAVTEQDK